MIFLFIFLQDRSISWVTVCNLKWVFFLMHQAWFLVVPMCAMALDMERGNKPPGSDLALDVWSKVRVARSKTCKARTEIVKVNTSKTTS